MISLKEVHICPFIDEKFTYFRLHVTDSILLTLSHWNCKINEKSSPSILTFSRQRPRTSRSVSRDFLKESDFTRPFKSPAWINLKGSASSGNRMDTDRIGFLRKDPVYDMFCWKVTAIRAALDPSDTKAMVASKLSSISFCDFSDFCRTMPELQYLRRVCTVRVPLRD